MSAQLCTIFTQLLIQATLPFELLMHSLFKTAVANNYSLHTPVVGLTELSKTDADIPKFQFILQVFTYGKQLFLAAVGRRWAY